jgi:hypothetical protein
MVEKFVFDVPRMQEKLQTLCSMQIQFNMRGRFCKWTSNFLSYDVAPVCHENWPRTDGNPCNECIVDRPCLSKVTK